MEVATTTTAQDEIKAEIQAVHDQQSEIHGRIAAWNLKRDEAQRKLNHTDGQIKSLEAEINRLDLDISGLGARWGRDEITMDEAQAKAALLAETKNISTLKLQILRGGRGVLAKRLESIVGANQIGQRPLAEEMAMDATLNQRLLFWELMEKYLETGSNNDQHYLMNKANYCRFSEEERDAADQIYRHVRKERGLFCDFSSRQIGGYQKSQPWAGC